MKRRNLLIGLVALFAIISFAFMSGAADSKEGIKTIEGTVNDYYQIVADNGQVYEIGDNDKGSELTELIGKRVKVKGTIKEDDEEKTIIITSYEVIEKSTK